MKITKTKTKQIVQTLSKMLIDMDRQDNERQKEHWEYHDHIESEELEYK